MSRHWGRRRAGPSCRLDLHSSGGNFYTGSVLRYLGFRLIDLLFRPRQHGPDVSGVPRVSRHPGAAHWGRRHRWKNHQ